MIRLQLDGRIARHQPLRSSGTQSHGAAPGAATILVAGRPTGWQIMADVRLVRHLREAARPNFNLVVDPDHPLIFDGPDALLSAPARLWAIFHLKSGQGDPVRLSARILATKLAYPISTQFILVEDSEQPLESWDTASRSFDGHFFIGDRLLRDFEDSTRSSIAAEAAEQARTQAIVRFDHALRATKLTSRGNWRSTGRIAANPRISVTDRPAEEVHFGAHRIRSKSRYDLDGIPVFISNARDQSLRQSLSRFASLQLLSDYGLDNGVPYATGTSDTGFVLTRGIDFAVPSDPKLLYATAFAGLGIAPDDDVELLRGFRDRLASFEAAQDRYRSTIFDDP